MAGTDQFAYEFGFIGMGNMGYAILKGLLHQYDPQQITFSARNREKMEDVAARTNVQPAADNRTCAAKARYVVLAVKPQQFDHVIEEIRDVISEQQIIISIAPGITIASLKERFGVACRIVRAMPNTPALVGEGMSGVCWQESELTAEEKDTIRGFFQSFGKMELVEEKLMDAVVCASGSSPAYVYLFIEALADSAVKYGIPRAAAYELVAQTVLGSARMVLETGEHPGKLKDQVCSPGGTTIAGVAALEEFGMRNAILKATDACYEKCTRIK
ncbi:MAG: pyrroline-5-carboxylate reductase [Lachnospiraceae bacterium]|nr:pyrroline-5-carboxylate reductase [Lachnospiraceae bacterium]